MKEKEKKIYTYEVIKPIKDYGFNCEIGDLMTSNEILMLAPYYKKFVKLLNSPVVK